MERKEKIISRAVMILGLFPYGLTYYQLAKRLQKEFPEFPVNTIQRTIWNLEQQVPNEVYKINYPAEGIFRHTRFRGEGVARFFVEDLETKRWYIKFITKPPSARLIGYHPLPGERAMGKDEWKRQYRKTRQTRSCSENKKQLRRIKFRPRFLCKFVRWLRDLEGRERLGKRQRKKT